jgi:hypothetical protein
MAPLSYLNIYRARKELKLMKSIQFRIQKGNYILRVTGKSGIFHLGHVKDYEQKAEAYRQKTWAYIDENNFIFIHSYLLHRLTAIEQQIATRITRADDSICHDPINDLLDQISLKPKLEWIEKVIIHYAHEARLTTYKRDIHKL